MTSKEMLGHLADMMIPAKSASSALEDAYVMVVRKKMAPILEARAAEIEAAKKAEEEARAKAEAEERARAEKERVEAEKRREAERARAEAERKKAEEARAEAERKRKEEEEKNRVRDNAPKSVPSMTSLLDQIAQQEKILKAQREEAAAKKKTEQSSGGRGRRGNGSSRPQRSNPVANDNAPVSPEKAAKASRGKHKGHRDNDGEDRYSRMAKAAEEYNRERVLEEARASVEEASRESTGRRKKRKERRQKQAEQAAKEQAIEEAIANDQNVAEIGMVKVPTGSTVAELAELLGVPASDIVKRLFLLGNPLTLTQSMSDELIELVADDLGREVKVMTKEEENSFTFYDDPADLLPRAPVVTVMGHVDHGKTSLLDAIRHTGVAEGEAGGITQAIGAYQVKVNDSLITFLDTPGHEAFTSMRARGANMTDIAVLVVAADDGIMPQTIESINHAKAANVKIIVAMNKMDKPTANPERVMEGLTKYGIITEDWGGDVACIPVSALTGMGINDLLERIALEAEVMELKANPNRRAKGAVVEARLDKGQGPIATILVQNGTLHSGDVIIAGTAVGRVRTMRSDKGQLLSDAGPSTPVEITGLTAVPEAGDLFEAVEDERLARELAEQRIAAAKEKQFSSFQKVTLDNLFSQMAQNDMKELAIVVKADVQGSAEAVKQSLEKISNDEVRVRVIHAGVGAISKSDVDLADASNAIIIGFNVRPDNVAKEEAAATKVEMRMYRVIYDAINDVTDAMKGMLAPKFREVSLGELQVRQVYKISNVGTVAGCRVTSGKITRDSKVRVVRDGIVIAEDEIASLKRFKDDAKEVAEGYECGVTLEKFADVKEGDVYEAFKMEEYRD